MLFGLLFAPSNASARAVWPMITPNTTTRSRPVRRDIAVPIATTSVSLNISPRIRQQRTFRTEQTKWSSSSAHPDEGTGAGAK